MTRAPRSYKLLGMEPLRRLDARTTGTGATPSLVRVERRETREPLAQLPVDQRPGSNGLAHGKATPVSGAAFVSSVLDAQVVAQYGKVLEGKEPVDAAAYAAITGITITPADAARLDAQVKKVAERIGLDHNVGFAAETKYLGFSYEYAFLGMFHGQNRKDGQPILLGAGLLAKTFEDLDLLYRFDTRGAGLPRALAPMIHDFLALGLEQRMEAVLVHEKLELEAAQWGSSNPHRSAVSSAPHTDLQIDPRVRKHLELYAKLDEALDGGR